MPEPSPRIGREPVPLPPSTVPPSTLPPSMLPVSIGRRPAEARDTAQGAERAELVRGGGRPRGAGSGRRRGATASDQPPSRRSATAGFRMRRFGNLAVLLPPVASPAQSLEGCLEKLRQDWRREGHEAALWQAWPDLAGPQLAPHCRPLQLHAGVLSVGAPPGPWLQALQYNRHQLLGALRAAGFRIREIRFQQHHPGPAAAASWADAAATWACHPSRIDVHGLADCPQCRRPAPAGEMARWGHCGFCRRADLAAQGPPPAAEVPLPEPGPAGSGGTSGG